MYISSIFFYPPITFIVQITIHVYNIFLEHFNKFNYRHKINNPSPRLLNWWLIRSNIILRWLVWLSRRKIVGRVRVEIILILLNMLRCLWIRLKIWILLRLWIRFWRWWSFRKMIRNQRKIIILNCIRLFRK